MFHFGDFITEQIKKSDIMNIRTGNKNRKLVIREKENEKWAC